MHDGAYVPLKQSRTAGLDIRGTQYCVRMWGAQTSTPLLLLHGTRDTSLTFQFLVDSLKHDWWVIAPDWRGHGSTGPLGADTWFHDYLADLDTLLDRLLPGTTVDLVGHSLGGNVATVYAGIRSERVRRVVSIDAFGLAERPDADFIQSLQGWLNGRPADEAQGKGYASVEQMARRLCSANARLSPDKALFLAHNISLPLPGGGFRWPFDSSRIRSMATLRRFTEWIECWRRIEAPALWVAAAEALPGSARSNAEVFGYLLDQIGRDRVVFVPDTGHNIQHDAPAALAAVIEQFLQPESQTAAF